MRVKIRGVWYDAKDELIVLEITAKDKSNITNMHTEKNHYLEFPDDSIDQDEFEEIEKEIKQIKESWKTS